MTELQFRFDELSRAIESPRSRRHVLKLGVGLVGAAVAATFPGRARGQANLCRDICLSLPPGPLRGECFKAAAQSDPSGLCAQCGADPTRLCTNGTNFDCCSETEHCCATSGTCVTCRPNETFSPATCTCECAIPCCEKCCAPTEFCCNESCSICAPIDGACIQIFCGPCPH
jgi:hypothetical protein